MYLPYRLTLFPIVLCVGSVSCLAATVTPNGDVYIDRGAGYQQVVGPTEANTGDVVMAMAGGTATISYDNGCLQTVDVGAVAVISEPPPCAANLTSTPGIDYTLVIGGVAVAGGIAAAIALSGDDDPPASP